MRSLVEGALETFRPRAVSKGLALDAEIGAGSEDALLGDPTRVRQIIFNLLSNALKFTERGVCWCASALCHSAAEARASRSP